jgi:protein-S-isoprenylcysteine O-methyltransferase Ste14
MDLLLYLLSATLLATASYVIFRLLVRRDYQRRKRLTPFTSLLQLLVWVLFFFFPTIYYPADWAKFWLRDGPLEPVLKSFGLAALAAGFALIFLTMIWFGLRRAFGLQVKGLVESGPYRFSRNPQIVGGYFLVVSMLLLYPSWYALGWVILYGFISHMMILTEEEHLAATFGRPYQRYCQRVARYLPFPKARNLS